MRVKMVRYRIPGLGRKPSLVVDESWRPGGRPKEQVQVATTREKEPTSVSTAPETLPKTGTNSK